ncbi:MAG: hypothetical protein B6226_02550 [Candidatus Cloacimonetes bacterium 4572_65]|nr:MAG: hypothetical protein B6226_02550 [Candidatus Cloacimonetes bacterium 4572_65]
MSKKKEIAIGGQAVIEGVMMRGPAHIATCIRRKDGSLELQKKSFNSITKRNKICGLPIVRGFASLIEMMIIGIKTLTFAANRYELDFEDPKEKAKSDMRKKVEEGFSFVFAFALAGVLFGVVPYYLSHWFDNNALFNVIAGSIRITFFVLYIFLISKMKDVNRVFCYHGAEHKSVHAWEQGTTLDAKEVQKHTTLHPRCGTSFIFLVLLVAIFFFSIIDTVVEANWIDKLAWWQRLAIHFPFLPLISGLSYEILKFSGKNDKHPLVKFVTAPGLALQKITTQPPTDEMVEVAIVAMKSALDLDVSEYKNLTILDVE